MALTVPLMVSNGSAVFSEKGGGELAFDLRVSIPIVKLVEALLCYQNRAQGVTGAWESLPPSTACPLSANAQAHASNAQGPPAALPSKETSPKAALAAVGPKASASAMPSKDAPKPDSVGVTSTANSKADEAPEGLAFLVNGTAWDVPIPTPAALLPHFGEGMAQRTRWQRRPDGLVAWNGMKAYDPPLANEVRLNMVRPKRLSVEPLPAKRPSSHAEHLRMPVARTSVSSDEGWSDLVGLGRWFSGNTPDRQKYTSE